MNTDPRLFGPHVPGTRVLVGWPRYEATVTHIHPQLLPGDLSYSVRMLATGLVFERVPMALVVSTRVDLPDHPDRGWREHQRTVVPGTPCGCPGGCALCLSETARTTACARCGEEWPCPVVQAYHHGRTTAHGPWDATVTATHPDGHELEGTVVTVEGSRLELRTPLGVHVWVDAGTAVPILRPVGQ